MRMTDQVIEGAYVRDLLEQPAALRRTLALPLPEQLISFAQQFAGPQPPFVLLTGMGSSFHVLHPLALRLAEHGIRATMIETSELIYFNSNLLGPQTLLVVVSQSGRSAEIIRLLELNAGRSPILGVTNDDASPLALAAQALVSINAGAEASVSCKTYVATLLALSRVAETLTSPSANVLTQALESVITSVESYLANWREHVEEAQDILAGTRHLILAGRGGSLASAGTGGLILKEAARFPAEGMSAAAFRHGPLEMVNSALLVLVFEGAERTAQLNRKLVVDIRADGGSAQLVGPHSTQPVFTIPAANEALQPILEILPVQMISLALAARQGLEAGAFLRATKITAVE